MNEARESRNDRAARFEHLIAPADATQEIKSKSVRGGMAAMGAEAADFVLRVGSIAVLARMLLPEDFGLVAMVTVITSVGERFKDMGLSAATVQRPSISHNQISTLFWVNSGIGAGLTMIAVLLAEPIAVFYDDGRLIAVTLALALSLLLGGLSIQHQALLRRTMQFGKLAAIQVGASLLSIALAIAMAALDFGYWALVAREVSRSLFVLIGTLLAFRWIPGLPTRQPGVGQMLSFGGNLTTFYFLHFLSMNFGQLLVGRLFGAAQLGLYRQGFNLILAPITQLVVPLTAVADSALCRLQNEHERYRKYFEVVLLLTAASTMPLSVFLAIFAPEIVMLILGPNWVEATDLFRILAIAVLVNPVVSMAGTVTVTCGHARRFFWFGFVEATTLICFFLSGIPWGTEGIVSAHIWAAYFLAAPWVYWCLKGTPVDFAEYLATLFRPFVATALMAAVLIAAKYYGMSENALVSGLIGGILAISSYATAWLIMPGGRRVIAELFVTLNVMRSSRE